MRYSLRLFAALFAAFLTACSIFTQNEKRQCPEISAYAGPAIHSGLDSAALLLDGSGFDGPLDSTLTARLDSTLEWVLDTTHATGVSVAVGIPGKGLWFRQKGLASVGPDRAVDSNTVFHLASIGKMFTAAAILQMVEKNRLKLEDTLSRWFPDIQDADKITVKQLLVHTSGLENFNGDSAFLDAGYQTPDELLAIAKRKGNLFCPGSHWYYSNTGYLLLALILEKLEKKPFHEILMESVIDTQRYPHISVLAPNSIPAQVAAPVVKGKVNTGFDQSMPFGAGNVASNAKDLVLFFNDYLSGKIISRKTLLAAGAEFYPMFDPGTFYGQGLMLYDLKDAAAKPISWVGHGGGAQGEKTTVAFDLRRRVFVAVLYNCDVSSEATALRLLAAVSP